MAITLGLIADLLVTNALTYAFPNGVDGRVGVSFTAHPKSWQLMVDDTGIALQAHGDRRDGGLIIARLLVLWLNGRLEIPEVFGGTRCMVTVPLPAARA